MHQRFQKDFCSEQRSHNSRRRYCHSFRPGSQDMGCCILIHSLCLQERNWNTSSLGIGPLQRHIRQRMSFDTLRLIDKCCILLHNRNLCSHSSSILVKEHGHVESRTLKREAGAAPCWSRVWWTSSSLLRDRWVMWFL